MVIRDIVRVPTTPSGQIRRASSIAFCAVRFGGSGHRASRLPLGAEDCPTKIPKTYADVVSAFYIGLAALQVGDDVHADSKLSEVTQSGSGRTRGLGQLGNSGAAAKKL